MLTTQIQIGKSGFQENNYLTIKNALINHDQVRIKFFKSSEERKEIEKIAEQIKQRLEKEIKKKIITKKIGFTLIIIKLRKRVKIKQDL